MWTGPVTILAAMAAVQVVTAMPIVSHIDQATSQNPPLPLQKRSGPTTVKAISSSIFPTLQSFDSVTTESEMNDLKEHIEKLRLGEGLGGRIPTEEQYELIEEIEEKLEERRIELVNGE